MKVFFIQNLIGKNLLFLQIIPARNAGGHYGGELDIVHHISGGVGGHFFFQDLFACAADAGGYSSKGRGFHKRFHELVVGHGYISGNIFSIVKKTFMAFIAQVIFFFTKFTYSGLR